jgi:hypothetical protein
MLPVLLTKGPIPSSANEINASKRPGQHWGNGSGSKLCTLLVEIDLINIISN